MMFLKRIKSKLSRYGRPHIHGGHIANIGVVDLNRLIDDYERIDSELRAYRSKDHQHLEVHLHEVIKAIYHRDEKSSDRILLTIFRAILPIIEEKETMQYFNYAVSALKPVPEDPMPMIRSPQEIVERLQYWIDLSNQPNFDKDNYGGGMAWATIQTLKWVIGERSELK